LAEIGGFWDFLEGVFEEVSKFWFDYVGMDGGCVFGVFRIVLRTLLNQF